MENLTDTQIQDMLAQIPESAKSYSSIKKVYDAMNACLKHAEKAGVISRNPMITMKAPSINNHDTKQIVIFTDEEVKKFL